MGEIQVVVCGYYGYGNGGDEALLMSLLQMLPKQVKPIVLSGNPMQTSDRYGVESCPNRSLFAVLKALGKADGFIWGGGSLMQDSTSLASPIYYASLMAFAQQQGLKTIAWAQGIGPLKSSFSQWITQRTLQGCSAVSVRDSASANLVSNWDIPSLVAPDPVWALESKSVKGLEDLPTPRIAVTLRPHSQLTPKRLANLTQALIDFQKATQTYILLVPFQFSQDRAIAHSIASQLSEPHQILSLEDPRELKGLFRDVEMVIGMRYHSLIMAAAEGCRCFALSYDPKVTQLMNELNFSGWQLEELPDDSNLITKRWLQEYTNSESFPKDLIQSCVDRALIHQELLTKVFKL